MQFTEQQVLTFSTHQCGSCGIWFAFDAKYEAARREDRASWFCPNGHERHFTGETLKEKADRIQREKAAIQARLDQERAARQEADAKLFRLKRRVKNGVCPCCQRSFTNLRRHIGTKHPEFAKAKP